MLTIEQLIGDLLLQNNCVIIPSFGGFVAQQVSAKIDYKTGKAFPPSKSILFNRQLINNDGLLINELSNQNKIPYEKASKIVAEKVIEWNQVIQAGGRVEIDRIGILYNDAENNLCFEQDRFFNLLLASFGLEQVRFITQEDVQIVEKTTATEDEMYISPIKIKPNSDEERNPEIVEHPVLLKKKNKVWKYVAAACILPIAFYSIWIPMKTDVLESGIVSFQDFNPFYKVEQFVYQQEEDNFLFTLEKEPNSIKEEIEGLPKEISVYSFKYDEDLFIPVAIEKESTVESNSVQEAKDSHNFSPESMNYIVGCFSHKTNADNLVTKLRNQGLASRIVDFNNGLYRVSAGSAISIEELNKIKLSANSLGLKGWTLK